MGICQGSNENLIFSYSDIPPAKYSDIIYSVKKGLDGSRGSVRWYAEVGMDTLLNIVATIIFFIIRLADRWA
jgi:hypothetical protein